ncbi:SDR family oxidoreductase [Vibrio quintilis]|uniref:NAD(P)H azoreductase n=1 Tax=Vibrio quintilis TaxID=1117707 RepID=A0A1M7YVA0_9VIBR|nr:SDR family oxidoreductase [Vibrio quintilis]SHO56508.1 NAD(P)H azoreductase [Vibrio quintilis]
MKEIPERILVAGSTGYLGTHIVRELLSNQAEFKALARNQRKLSDMGLADTQIHLAEVTDPVSLAGCCDGIDVVISCVGITRQKDGVGYMGVDFQGNLNLLKEAQRAGVRKFIYISALNAPQFPDVRLLRAKECFAQQLLSSDIPQPCVIRPNGFFSDIEEMYRMARSGRVYLFGRGESRLNPIHGSDLARFCLEAIDKPDRESDIGGPDVLSLTDIARLAFAAQNKPERITFLPDWIRKVCLSVAAVLPEKYAGPVEFFLTTIAKDMVAPTYGHHRLDSHFQQLAQTENRPS